MGNSILFGDLAFHQIKFRHFGVMGSLISGRGGALVFSRCKNNMALNSTWLERGFGFIVIGQRTKQLMSSEAHDGPCSFPAQPPYLDPTQSLVRKILHLAFDEMHFLLQFPRPILDVTTPCVRRDHALC